MREHAFCFLVVARIDSTWSQEMTLGVWVATEAAQPPTFPQKPYFLIFQTHVASVAHGGGCVISPWVGRKNKPMNRRFSLWGYSVKDSGHFMEKNLWRKYRPSSEINMFNKRLVSNVHDGSWAGGGMRIQTGWESLQVTRCGCMSVSPH